MLQEAFKKLKGVPAQSAREVMINQAMRLAYFIHRDQELAAHITTEALIKLNAAAVAQDRRYLYEPGGRASQGIRARNKIMLSELHLLQRILFHESEPYERQTELYFQTKPDQRRMIVHYLKHLVSVTLKRNSFYTTLGITRLLCRYTTAEAMDIYNLVVQDPARVKDDYYWRSRKGHLMQDMRERFGPFLQSSRGTRGEERFVARADLRDGGERVGKPAAGGIPLGRIDVPVEMVRCLALFFQRWACTEDTEIAVDLHAVGVDDFATDTLGQRQG